MKQELCFNRRQVIQNAALFAGALSLESLAYASTFREDSELEQGTIKVEKLADNVHVLMGVGGNIAILTGPDGLIQIDSGNKGTYEAQQTAIKSISDKRIIALINTHWHADHTGSNEDLGKSGAKIVGHDNLRKRLSSDQFIEAFNAKIPASAEVAQPTVTFDNRMTIYHGVEKITMAYMPPAHTDTDIVIHLGKSNIVHLGDIFFNGMYPFIDSSTGGWIGGMVQAAGRILTHLEVTTKIIPGHGPVGDKAQFKAYHEMLVAVQEKISPLVQTGKSVDEIVAMKPLADTDAKWGNGFMKPDTFVKIVVGGIKKFGK